LVNIDSVRQSLEEGLIAIEGAKNSTYNRLSKTNKKCMEEQDAASYFKETTKRDAEGRFVLRLPLKSEVSNVGDTLNMVTSRFLSIEQRLQKSFCKDESLKSAYVIFMEEYERAGHIIEVNEDSGLNKLFYLPHHPILKASSLITKL